MPHCYVKVEKKNIGFKNCAKTKGDRIALAEARRVQTQLNQRMTQPGDVIQPKDSDSAQDSALCDPESSLVHHICSFEL